MSYIKREDALDAVLFALVGTGYQSNAIYAIRDVPTADVVEVVRCKDCAYYRKETSYCLNPHCSSSFYGHRVKENHYCSYGERREE